MRVSWSRVALCVGVCAGLLSCSSPPPAPPVPAPADGPGAELLAGWKLTLPTTGGSGNAGSVNPARVTPPWLTTDPGGNLVFWAPVSGATTPNSKHTRTELNYLRDFPAGAGPQALAASVSVGQVPPQTQKVIIGQIHGAADISSVPFVMLFYTAGTVQMVVKQQQSGDAHINYPLLTEVPTGARFDYGIRDNGDGSLTFTADFGAQHAAVNAPLPDAFRNATVRFQAGAYQQDSSAGGSSSPDDGARVTFYALSIGTGAAPPPPTP